MSERLQGLPPIVSRQTRLIVLGSFPGVASLQARQYYAHPRNQFWPILAALWGVDFSGASYPRRIAEIRRRGLGLWDVHASCERVGSLDSKIEAALPNDLAGLRRRAPQLSAVAHNGAESARSSKLSAALDVPVFCLPSTSPANASWSFDRKLSAWRAVFESTGLI